MNTNNTVGLSTSMRNAIIYKATHPNVEGIYIGCRLDSLDNYYTSSNCFDAAIAETGIKPTLTAIDTLSIDWSNKDNWKIPYQREREVYILLEEMGATLLNGMRPVGSCSYVYSINKGKTLNKKHRQKISDSRTGYVVTDETREKIKKSSKGRKHTDKARQKMSKAAQNRGPVTDEARNNMSEARKKYWAKRKALT
jgi:hypothetical protein